MIIIKTNMLIKKGKLQEIRNSIIDQIPSGVVVIPCGFDAVVVDDDTKLILEWKKADD